MNLYPESGGKKEFRSAFTAVCSYTQIWKRKPEKESVKFWYGDHWLQAVPFLFFAEGGFAFSWSSWQIQNSLLDVCRQEGSAPEVNKTCLNSILALASLWLWATQLTPLEFNIVMNVCVLETEGLSLNNPTLNLLAVCSWERHLTSLCFSFLTCKMSAK